MPDDDRVSYYPPRPPDPHTKGIKWGVWILVTVFVILPLLACAACVFGTPIFAHLIDRSG